MLLLAPRYRSDTKPPLGCALDRGNPLSSGLQLCCFLNEAGGQILRDSARGIVGMVNGSLTSTWATVGRGLGFKQTSNGPYIDFGPVSQFGITKQFSIATLAPWDNNVIGTGQHATRPFVAYDTFFNADFGITNGDAGAGAGLVGWQFSLRTVNQTLIITGPPSQGTGAHLTYADLAVGTYDGTTANIYVNGVLASNATDTSGLNLNQNTHLTLTGWAANTQSFNQPLLFAALWNRALSPAEVASLWVSPYQMAYAPKLVATGLLGAVAGGGGAGLGMRRTLAITGTRTGSRNVHRSW